MSKVNVAQISEVNNINASCRVVMDDLKTPAGEAMISGNLQMLFPAVDQWNFFFIPKAGDHVATLRLPNGLSEGYILGKPYTASNMPQGGEEGVFLMVSSDGKNVVKLDGIKGKFDMVIDQMATAKIKKVDIEVAENVDSEVHGNKTSEVKGNETREVGGNVSTTIKGNETREISMNQTIEVTGNYEHTSANTDIKSIAPIGLNDGLYATGLMPYMNAETASVTALQAAAVAANPAFGTLDGLAGGSGTVTAFLQAVIAHCVAMQAANTAAHASISLAVK